MLSLNKLWQKINDAGQSGYVKVVVDGWWFNWFLLGSQVVPCQAQHPKTALMSNSRTLTAISIRTQSTKLPEPGLLPLDLKRKALPGCSDAIWFQLFDGQGFQGLLCDMLQFSQFYWFPTSLRMPFSKPWRGVMNSGVFSTCSNSMGNCRGGKHKTVKRYGS